MKSKQKMITPLYSATGQPTTPKKFINSKKSPYQNLIQASFILTSLFLLFYDPDNLNNIVTFNLHKINTIGKVTDVYNELIFFSVAVHNDPAC